MVKYKPKKIVESWGLFAFRAVAVSGLMILLSWLTVYISGFFSQTGKYVSAVAAIFGLLWLAFGIIFRPGDEKFAATVLLIASVLTVATIGITFDLAWFGFIDQINSLSAAIVGLGSLWLADGVFIRIMNAMGVKVK